MSEIQKIESFFGNLEHKVQADLVALFGKTAVDSTEAEVKTILSAAFLQIFNDGVSYASTLANASGADKKAAAFNKITTDLATQGKTLPDQLINFGIELVLSLFKAKAA